MNNNLIAFIPARKGSKSIKNKNLKLINKKSLVEITIDQAIKSKIFNRIILSSDSKKILEIGKKKKILTIKRPKKFSLDKSLTEDSLFHSILNLREFKNFNYGIIILQPTSPLRKISTIKNFAKICRSKKINHALSVSKIDHNISIENKKRKFKILANKNIRRRQDRLGFVFENGLLYYVTKNSFLKNKKIYSSNWNYYETDLYESIDINHPNDLKIARLTYRKI